MAKILTLKKKDFIDKASLFCVLQKAKLKLAILQNMVPSSSPPCVATHNQPVRHS